ncbi:biotin/lipoyl-binding carrier protein [Nocardia sp. NBC_01009]|uniref:biotin/lipoyl-binding carrier protein n=1 Tax=Nocardia sp. NBC_01009 TaxID=2975996 RepID=UPI0038663DE9|nr:biotin/lipoyl-binding carrier protein [Nocardia sp. NBC_01009]
MAEEVRAEMVSTVLTVEVAVGDKVELDQTLVLLESMKMEIPVVAEIDGEVTSIVVAPGQVLKQGDLIAVIS